MYKAVVFDMDGVLIDTEKIYRMCWKKNGMSIGVTKDKEIMFFDANHYIETRNFDGFVVKMESLVK